jgi:hypothetical protein
MTPKENSWLLGRFLSMTCKGVVQNRIHFSASCTLHTLSHRKGGETLLCPRPSAQGNPWYLCRRHPETSRISTFLNTVVAYHYFHKMHYHNMQKTTNHSPSKWLTTTPSLILWHFQIPISAKWQFITYHVIWIPLQRVKTVTIKSATTENLLYSEYERGIKPNMKATLPPTMGPQTLKEAGESKNCCHTPQTCSSGFLTVYTCRSAPAWCEWQLFLQLV